MARPSARRTARMTAPLSCTRHEDCRLRRAALRRAEPSEANEWRAVRGGAHGVGAGVGDDDGAPVLHKKPWANGRTKYASLMGALCGIASERA